MVAVACVLSTGRRDAGVEAVSVVFRRTARSSAMFFCGAFLFSLSFSNVKT